MFQRIHSTIHLMVAACALMVIVATPQPCAAQEQKQADKGQQYFELRIYEVYDFEKQKVLEDYLEDSLLPALKRMKIGNVGVFTNLKDVNDHFVYVLIPFDSVETFSGLNSRLVKDTEYQKSASEYFARELRDPVYKRINSRLLKAFEGMPQLSVPRQAKNGEPRIFELRLYESHTEQHAALKVEMFNKGEIDVMVDAKMGPVFFGETLAGKDVPNLIYMLSASNDKEHKEHWQAFLKHPKWKEMSKMERYKDTVSKIQSTFLKPTSYSGL